VLPGQVVHPGEARRRPVEDARVPGVEDLGEAEVAQHRPELRRPSCGVHAPGHELAHPVAPPAGEGLAVGRGPARPGRRLRGRARPVERRGRRLDPEADVPGADQQRGAEREGLGQRRAGRVDALAVQQGARVVAPVEDEHQDVGAGEHGAGPFGLGGRGRGGRGEGALGLLGAHHPGEQEAEAEVRVEPPAPVRRGAQEALGEREVGQVHRLFGGEHQQRRVGRGVAVEVEDGAPEIVAGTPGPRGAQRAGDLPA
jgi:hypothetical protein